MLVNKLGQINKTATILLAMVLLSLPMRGQNFLSRSEVGLTLGGMNYLGDLNDQSMFGKVSLGYGIMGRCNLDSRWAITLGANYGHVSGGHPDVNVRRNLSFQSYVAEGFLRAEFNFVPYGLGSGALKRSTPYIFCGIGFFKFNPRTLYVNELDGTSAWYDLQPLGTEGQGTAAFPDRPKYQLIEACMPFGIGYRWRLSPGCHLTAEYGWRKTWTDYLDDVSTTYVGSDVLMGQGGGGSMAAQLADRSDEVVPGYVNAPGIKRGDDSLDDWYAYFNVTLSFSAEVLFGWMRGKSCER